MLSEFRKYPRWCPNCKLLHQAIWKECTRCKTPLVSSLWRLPYWIFRKLLPLVAIVAILASFCVFSYFIQGSERHFYRQSFDHFKDGHYQEAWNEFEKAFGYNPVVRWVRAGIDGAGRMAPAAKTPAQGSAGPSAPDVPKIVPGSSSTAPQTYHPVQRFKERPAPSFQEAVHGDSAKMGFVKEFVRALFVIMVVLFSCFLSGVIVWAFFIKKTGK